MHFHIRPPWFTTRVVKLVKFVLHPPDITVTLFLLFLLGIAYFFITLGIVYLKHILPLPFNYIALMAIFIASWLLGERVEKWSEDEESYDWAIKGIVIHLLLILFYVSGSYFLAEYAKILDIIGNQL